MSFSGGPGDDDGYGRGEPEGAIEDLPEALLAAAATMRRRIRSEESWPPVPTQYALLSVARLLEELSRSMGAGHPQDDQVTEAAAEIAHHVLRHSGH